MKDLDKRILVITWPRWVWKTHNLDFILKKFNEKIMNIPQISCREKRVDDNENYIKIVTPEVFKSKISEMLVHNGKYWILKRDIDRAYDKLIIPTCILWWKEIIKLKKQEVNLVTLNITYPLNSLSHKLDKDIENLIIQRMSLRWINKQDAMQEIEKIILYMKIFFNNPKFQKYFDYNLFSKENWKELEKIIVEIIKNEFNI